MCGSGSSARPGVTTISRSRRMCSARTVWPRRRTNAVTEHHAAHEYRLSDRPQMGTFRECACVSPISSRVVVALASQGQRRVASRTRIPCPPVTGRRAYVECGSDDAVALNFGRCALVGDSLGRDPIEISPPARLAGWFWSPAPHFFAQCRCVQPPSRQACWRIGGRELQRLEGEPAFSQGHARLDDLRVGRSQRCAICDMAHRHDRAAVRAGPLPVCASLGRLDGAGPAFAAGVGEGERCRGRVTLADYANTCRHWRYCLPNLPDSGRRGRAGNHDTA